MIAKISRRIPRSLVLLAIAGTFAFPLVAQKKGGAASSGAAAPAAAAPSASGGSSSNAPVEVEWLAYSALDRIMGKIADYSCGKASQGVSDILVLDTPAFQALQAYDSFYMQAESIKAAFADMAPRAGAGGGVDDFADITGAVTATAVATTSESSSSFTIQDPTVALALLSRLHNNNADICKKASYAGVYEISSGASSVDIPTMVYKAAPSGASDEEKAQVLTKQPATMKLPTVPVELASLSTSRQQTLLTILGKLPSSSPAVCRAVALPVQGSQFSQVDGGWTPPPPVGWTLPVPPDGGWKAVAKPAAGASQPPPPVTSVGSTDPCLSAFNNVDSTYTAFLTALSTPNSTTGQTAVAAAKQGYKLRSLFKQSSAAKPILGIYVNVAAAGGTQQDRKNLILALTTGDLIRYSGGVSVNVIVFKAAGADSKILFADLVRYRTPLTQIKSPICKDGLNSGDNLEVIPKADGSLATTNPCP